MDDYLKQFREMISLRGLTNHIISYFILLYGKIWHPYIKEIFHGFGNAIEYLGRYAHKIAISNSRILSVDEQQIVFSARGKQPGELRRVITLENIEFIRCYLMQVFLPVFQKI